MAIKVGMVSLGCPKNQMDAELMLARLEQAGMQIVAESGLAQVVIVNTCGFIEDAKREAIENILEFAQLKKEGQISRIIVTGCLAERYREELARELPECDAVLGLGANGDIVQAVRDAMDGEKTISFPPKSCWELDGARVQTTPSFFAYLRIADGCDNRCTYCAIPGIRGPFRSRKMETLVQEARELVQNGVKELTLVAQDTTLYGKDLYGESKLPQLLEQLCAIDGLEWIRLLYCYPEHISEELLDVMARQPKIAKYMDIPLQHASGRVLHTMNRPGDAQSLTALMERIRKKVPGIVLRTTVMVGFPGETEDDFEQLCAFLKKVKFEKLGCFIFSPEEGTPAERLPDRVPRRVSSHRQELVMDLQNRISEKHLQSQIGREIRVMAESYDRYAGCWFGRSEADAPDIDGKVFFQSKTPLRPGDMVAVEITDCMDYDLMGVAK